MDLLVEKLDGSRYYLSQYKVLITDFEESAPSVTRNNKQLDQRNGNIDFGGWHTDKTINITGYYRADDMDEEEMLREKLYALLSDPDGYYITQLKTTPSVAMERPGETSGGYYDKLSNYPSHKRFLVYTEAPEMELVGSVNGTLLYKLTVEFKTMKLPYGESVPLNLDVKPNVPYYSKNLALGTSTPVVVIGKNIVNQSFVSYSMGNVIPANTKLIVNCDVDSTDGIGTFMFQAYGNDSGSSWQKWTLGNLKKGSQHVTVTFVAQGNIAHFYPRFDNATGTITISNFIISTAPSPWNPAPEDQEYNKWYFDTYYNTQNLAIPYSGTVPCNQLEQGFAIEMTAKGTSSSLSFKIDDTELTYSGAVASGDVFMFSGFSYTQNGLSIVSKTNKAYFILRPDKPNKITCNVPGTVRIIGFQNLYA